MEKHSKENFILKSFHKQGRNSKSQYLKQSVHFNSFKAEKAQPRASIRINPEPRKFRLQRSALKKNATFCNLLEPTSDSKEQDQINTLTKLNFVRFPGSLRKNHEENVRIISNLLNSPIISKSSIMRQLKCFMSNSSAHDSYLISKQLATKAKQELCEINRLNKYTYRYDELAQFIKKLDQRSGNCNQLLQAYEVLVKGHTYPSSVYLMIQYMGIHLYSINNQYVKAEQICSRLLDQIIKIKVDLLIPIYLILMIKLKSNQAHWKTCLPYISRALSAAWLYRLPDLEIWCYFQFGRAHFALGNTKECEFFKERSEMSILQPSETVFRDMMQHQYRKEIQLIRTHNYSFDLNHVTGHHQLSKNPQREGGSTVLKIQVYAKSIAQNFKIKHVKNLIGRLGEQIPQSISNQPIPFAGNPQFLTHESGIKNLNIYFRQSGQSKQFYTFEGSVKNTMILKQMARNLLLQMKWYVPIVDL